MKNFKFKPVKFLALVYACSLLLSWGCGQAPEPEKKSSEPFVGVLLYKKDDAYISIVSAALEKELGAKARLEVLDAKGSQITQNGQVDDLLHRKADVLLINLVDTQGAAYIVDKAKKAGIPAIFFNREPDLDIIKAYNKAYFVGTRIEEAGQMQGDAIKKIWLAHPEYDRNKDGKCQYVMLQGDIDNPEALSRSEHSVKRARENGLDMRQIGETYVCNWDENQAEQAMLRALATYAGQIELVIANNDSMALGAIKALNSYGFNKNGSDKSKFIPVVGVDATPQAVEAIQKGVMNATVKQDGDAMAKAISLLTLNALANKSFLQDTPYSADSSGVAVRIAYQPYSLE